MSSKLTTRYHIQVPAVSSSKHAPRICCSEYRNKNIPKNHTDQSPLNSTALILIACSCRAITAYPFLTIRVWAALPGQGLDLFWQTTNMAQEALRQWVVIWSSPGKYRSLGNLGNIWFPYNSLAPALQPCAPQCRRCRWVWRACQSFLLWYS
jgi:hypothetical protein